MPEPQATAYIKDKCLHRKPKDYQESSKISKGMNQQGRESGEIHFENVFSFQKPFCAQTKNFMVLLQNFHTHSRFDSFIHVRAITKPTLC